MAQNTNITIEGVGQYLYWLCGQFQLQAQNLTGGGIVVPTGGSTPNPVEFIVSSTSPIPTGGSTLVLLQFRGFNIIFSRNDIIQSQVNNGGTYFSWNRVTGVFTSFGAASEDELYSINAV